MVSALDCLGTLCCVLGKDTLLSRCLSPPRCGCKMGKWVAANLLCWTSIPSRGEKIHSKSFHAKLG